MSRHSPRCPDCPGGPAGVHLIFGLPDEELSDSGQRGDIVLGGCVLDPGPPARWACPRCGRQLGGTTPGLGSQLPSATAEPADSGRRALRVGTWNLEHCPTPWSGKGTQVAVWQQALSADIWLLTEVHRDWASPAGEVCVSAPRGGGTADTKRWAGIQTRLRLEPIDAAVPEDRAAAEESLCLARVYLPAGAVVPSVLVACSVLPWGGAGKWWPGLPEKYLNDQQAFVLSHHIDRIDAVWDREEPIVWGGDFNQELQDLTGDRKAVGYRLAGTGAGIERLGKAFQLFGLRPLTVGSEGRDPLAPAIDHLAASDFLTADAASVYRPSYPDGTLLSDHAAYTADAVLEHASRSGARVAS